jgi:hypothetical protein
MTSSAPKGPPRCPCDDRSGRRPGVAGNVVRRQPAPPPIANRRDPDRFASPRSMRPAQGGSALLPRNDPPAGRTGPSLRTERCGFPTSRGGPCQRVGPGSAGNGHLTPTARPGGAGFATVAESRYPDRSVSPWTNSVRRTRRADIAAARFRAHTDVNRDFAAPCGAAAATFHRGASNSSGRARARPLLVPGAAGNAGTAEASTIPARAGGRSPPPPPGSPRRAS